MAGPDAQFQADHWDRHIDSVLARLRRAMADPDSAAQSAAELADLLVDRYQRRLVANDLAGAADDLDELVSRLDAALAILAPGSSWHDQLAWLAAEAHQEHWAVHGASADRDAAIGYLDAVVGTAPEESLPELHAALARLHAARADDQELGPGQEADLAAAERHARAGLACLASQPDDQPPQPDGRASAGQIGADLRLTLGLTLATRFAGLQGRVDPAASHEVASARSCRDEAIAALNAVLGELPAAEPAWTAVADALGRTLYDRYADAWPGAPQPSAQDLHTAIDLLAATVTTDPEPVTVTYLVFALWDRLGHRPDESDRDQLITWCEWLLRFGEAPDADDNTILLMLSAALTDRADASPRTRLADLTAVISHLEAALALTPAADPDRASILTDLAHACWQRLDGDSSRHDWVDQLTRHAERAWSLLPPGSEDRTVIGLYLATGTHERLLRDGAGVDLPAMSRAIEVLTVIEPLLADEPDAHLLVTVMLGHFLAARGQATSSAADISAARPWLLAGASELPADDPGWAEITQTLAAGLSVLASLGMDADHLDQAIAVLATAAGRPDLEPARAAMTRGTLGQLLIQRAGFTADWRDLDDGISHLVASHELAPPGHAYRAATGMILAAALLTRFLERGQAEDVDAARFYLATAEALAGPGGDEVRSLMADADMVIAVNKGLLGIADGMRGDPAALDGAVTSLRAVLSALPPGHPHRSRVRSDLGLALTMRAMSPARQPGDLEEAGRTLDAALAGLTDGHMMRPLALLRAGAFLVAAAITTGDQWMLRQAIGHLGRALDDLDPRFGNRSRFTALLGLAAFFLHQHTRDPGDADRAVTWLEAVRSDLAAHPAHPLFASCLISLARAYRARGDARAAEEAGLAALRGRARDLLLQSGTARSLSYARQAAAESAEVAAWCLEHGRPAAAVEALELGRGLILHAATCVTGIPELLAAAGREDLAQLFRDAAATTGDALWDAGIPGAEHLPGLLHGVGLAVPDDVRARALAALAGSDAERRLLAPPSPADLAASLAQTGADAVVYLLGSSGGQPGRAVIVAAAGPAAATAPPAEIVLPSLRGEPYAEIQAYSAAFAAVRAGPARGNLDPAGQDGEPGVLQAIRRWRQALEELCDWAWAAVMRPVLSFTHAWQLGRPPRLVLIPVGVLTLVPWHAARQRAGGTGPARYALHEAVISYAASGRQLQEVAARPALALNASPVVVGDPTRTLPGALLEAQAILARCYPAGRYLGPGLAGWDRAADGPGAPGEVLVQLPAASGPGASMLHLGCHGAVVRSAPGKSHLLLAGNQELRVDAILRQAAGRPPASAGGLVSLAACSSDLSLGDYDEALTLATAFLAAGAVTVVGARWPVPDDATSLLMFMFHYFMSHRAQSPRDALRSAQLWLLDAGRATPPEMPASLAQRLMWRGITHVTAWAGIVHQGQ